MAAYKYNREKREIIVHTENIRKKKERKEGGIHTKNREREKKGEAATRRKKTKKAEIFIIVIFLFFPLGFSTFINLPYYLFSWCSPPTKMPYPTMSFALNKSQLYA